MKNLRSVFVAIVLCIVSHSIYGQKSIEKEAKILTNKMNTSLKLSEEQKEKIYDINFTFLKEIEKTKKISDDKAKVIAMKKAVDKRESTLNTILTDAQKKKIITKRDIKI